MLSFSEKYFVQEKYEQAESMLYGNRELFTYLNEAETSLDNIVVSKSISEAHIFKAFYSRMDPREYQKATKNWLYKDLGFNWVDQIPIYTLGKYIFTDIDYQKFSSLPNVLLVGRPDEFPAQVAVVAKIKYPDLTDAFWVVNPDIKPFAFK